MPGIGIIRKIVAALGIDDPAEVDEFRRLLTDEPGPEVEHTQVLSEATDPVLADLWNNDEDAVYDEMFAELQRRSREPAVRASA